MTWLVKNRLAAFERQHGYDASYMRELLAADPKAFWAFVRATKMNAYRRDVPKEPYYAASLVALMTEDCGPCTQLCVGKALADGCTQTVIGNVIAGDDVALPDDVRLAVQFARAVLARSTEADPLRETIVATWGARGPRVARARDHDGAALSDDEVRARVRQGVCARARRRQADRAAAWHGRGMIETWAPPAVPRRAGVPDARLARRGRGRRAGRVHQDARRRHAGAAGVPRARRDATCASTG